MKLLIHSLSKPHSISTKTQTPASCHSSLPAPKGITIKMNSIHTTSKTPRLRPVRSNSKLANPSSPNTASYIPLMSISPIFSFADRDPAATGIDAESYIPNIQLAERAKVVFSGKAVMVNYTGRRASMGEESSAAGGTSRDVRRGSLNEVRHGGIGLEEYRESGHYRASSGPPERSSVTLRRLRSSAGRPRVETITGVNKSTATVMRESIWWQTEFNIDGARIFSTRNL